MTTGLKIKQSPDILHPNLPKTVSEAVLRSDKRSLVEKAELAPESSSLMNCSKLSLADDPDRVLELLAVLILRLGGLGKT